MLILNRMMSSPIEILAGSKKNPVINPANYQTEAGGLHIQEPTQLDYAIPADSILNVKVVNGFPQISTLDLDNLTNIKTKLLAVYLTIDNKTGKVKKQVLKTHKIDEHHSYQIILPGQSDNSDQKTNMVVIDDEP